VRHARRAARGAGGPAGAGGGGPRGGALSREPRAGAVRSRRWSSASLRRRHGALDGSVGRCRAGVAEHGPPEERAACGGATWSMR
jgi:hypothetical protein